MSRIWFFLVLLSIERLCTHPVRTRITNRVRRKLAAEIANLFCMLGPVSGLLYVCH
ncbi:MAG: hypothetical protein WCC03_13620 [Candidatus Acidiferrales bacterium]